MPESDAMSAVEEAREALEAEALAASSYSHDADHLMNKADDYAQARALAAHVDACCKVGWAARRHPRVRCGDGWYCDKAKKLMRLGGSE